MMKKNVVLLFFLLSLIAFGQVGVGTNYPKATLDVRKVESLSVADGVIPPRITADSLELKSSAYGEAQNGVVVNVTKGRTNTIGVNDKTRYVNNSGLYMYDATYVNKNSSPNGLWKKSTSGDVAFSITVPITTATPLSSLSTVLNLLGSEFKTLTLPAVSNTQVLVDLGGEYIDTSDKTFVVPEDGLYHIDFDLRVGTGLVMELLSGAKAYIAITKNRNLLASSLFGGASGLVGITINQGSINKIFVLKKNDKLNFGLIKGGLSDNDLKVITANISLFRVR